MVLDLRRRSEDGIAIVVALLVTVIAFVVVTGVLAQAIHNVVQSGYGRRRLAAISAAEAGLNWYANQLSTSNLVAISTPGLGWVNPSAGCQTRPLGVDTCWYRYVGLGGAVGGSRALAGTIPEQATFEVHVLYTSQNPCQGGSPPAAKPCSMSNIPSRVSTIGHPGVATPVTGVLLLKDTTAEPFPNPAYAIVRSIGKVGNVTRSLESYVRLRAIRGGVEGGLAAISLCLAKDGKVHVQGDLAINNEAVGGVRPAAFNNAQTCQTTYSTGDLVVGSGDELILTPGASGQGSLSIRGGGITVEGNSTFQVSNDLWVEGAIRIGCSAGATCASTLNACKVSGTIQCVKDDAIGSSITLGPDAFVEGEPITCSPACPPPASFPEIIYREAEWRAAGWNPVNVNNTAGLLDELSKPTRKTVFYVMSETEGDGQCDLYFSKAKIVLQARIAVVSKCRFVFRTAGSTLTAAAGSEGSLMLISTAPEGGASTANCDPTPLTSPYGRKDVSIENEQHIQAPLFIYTPCIIWIKGNQANPSDPPGSITVPYEVQGQFVGRFMIIKNVVNLTQSNVADFVANIPGQIFRFEQDVKFIREIPEKFATADASL